MGIRNDNKWVWSNARRKEIIIETKGSSSEMAVFLFQDVGQSDKKKEDARQGGGNRVYAARDPTLLDPNIIPPVHQISTTI